MCRRAADARETTRAESHPSLSRGSPDKLTKIAVAVLSSASHFFPIPSLSFSLTGIGTYAAMRECIAGGNSNARFGHRDTGCTMSNIFISPPAPVTGPRGAGPCSASGFVAVVLGSCGSCGSSGTSTGYPRQWRFIRCHASLETTASPRFEAFIACRSCRNASPATRNSHCPSLPPKCIA